MLDKYLKFLKGKPDPLIEPAKPQPSSATTGGNARAPLLPPIEPQIVSRNDRVVDTDGTSPETVVTSVMDIETHGARNQAGEMLKRFLGHQPILDGENRILGYELMLRNKTRLSPSPASETIRKMQDEMLIVSAIDLDFQNALGNKLAFINLSPASLQNPLIDELPKKKVAVSVQLEPDPSGQLLERCRELVSKGIPLALEDFTYQPVFDPFLRLCRYVRIDTNQHDVLTLSEQINDIRKAGSPLLIAKGVETEDAFEAYRKLAFDSFQGFYLTQLQPAAPQRVDSNRIRVMELLNMVMSHAEIKELEEKVKLDVALSYKLLNYINSPANGLQQKIQSIGHAHLLLGYDQLNRWLTLLLFTAGKPDERSRALLKNALIRARFTETLGKEQLPASQHGGLFIVGIFSVLDALLNIPMEQAVTRLNLPQPIVDALTQRQGIYAPYLQLAMACEDFDQDTIASYAAACGLSADQVNIAHVKALIWAEELEH